MSVLETNEKLCKALGVDLSTSDVVKVVLTIESSKHPVVTVTRYPPDQMLPPFTEEYELIKKDKTDGTTKSQRQTS